jgi:hypothetical protein
LKLTSTKNRSSAIKETIVTTTCATHSSPNTPLSCFLLPRGRGASAFRIACVLCRVSLRTYPVPISRLSKYVLSQYASQLCPKAAWVGSIRIELGCFEKTTDMKGRKGESFSPGPAIRRDLCGEILMRGSNTPVDFVSTAVNFKLLTSPELRWKL